MGWEEMGWKPISRACMMYSGIGLMRLNHNHGISKSMLNKCVFNEAINSPHMIPFRDHTFKTELWCDVDRSETTSSLTTVIDYFNISWGRFGNKDNSEDCVYVRLQVWIKHEIVWLSNYLEQIFVILFYIKTLQKKSSIILTNKFC